MLVGIPHPLSYTHIVDFHFANVDTKAWGDHSSISVRSQTGQDSFYLISRKTRTVPFVKSPLQVFCLDSQTHAESLKLRNLSDRWIAEGRNNVACSHRQELDRGGKGWREQPRDL